MTKQRGKTLQKQLSVDRQQTLAVLRDYYGVVGVELRFLAQGYSHKSYLFNAPLLGGEVVGKIAHPGKSRPDGDLYFESLVADFLADHGYPAQFPYKSLRGNYFERTADGRNVQVLKYLEETTPRQANNKQRIIHSGKMLSHFHKVSRRFRPEDYPLGASILKSRTFFLRKRLSALESNLRSHRRIKPADRQQANLTEDTICFLTKEYRKISRLLNERRRNLLPKYIIHGDYNPGNLVFNRNEVCGVIDFEHSALGPFYWDIGFAIAHWSFLLNRYGAERITNFFVQGYMENNGRVSIRLVKAFRSFSALWRLGDAIRYYPKYKNKRHWAGEVGYYLRKCQALAS